MSLMYRVSAGLIVLSVILTVIGAINGGGLLLGIGVLLAVPSLIIIRKLEGKGDRFMIAAMIVLSVSGLNELLQALMK